MKAKIPAAPPAVPPSNRRTKTPSAQMSLLDWEPDAVPAPANTPSKPAAKKSPVVVTAQKPKAAPKAPARVRVGAEKKPSAAEPVRIVPETLLASGALWRMSGKHGVAYVKDAALAGELLATDTRNLPKAAMAVYYDKKGKAFAWQIRFDTDRWEEVLKRLA